MTLSRLSIAVLALVFLAASLRGPPAHAQPSDPLVGFERHFTGDGTEVGVWYPARGTSKVKPIGLSEQVVVEDVAPIAGRYPLIVMSHGTGGDLAGHADTAGALARAGFVVAALTHPGDNWRDNSRATRIEERPRALGALITHMTTTWAHRDVIDADRIGAFGFSAGGFTVLAAAGGRPDLSRLTDHCAANPGFFDCRLLASNPRTDRGAWPDVADPRIKAVVVAAPALGFTYDKAGLEAVRVPVQLWRADEDEILPAPHYADMVRQGLPVSPEFRAVPGAGHFDFLAPCRAGVGQPMLCESAPGFDRMAFHADFNAQVARFFTRTLSQAPAQDEHAAGEPLNLVERYLKAQQTFDAAAIAAVTTGDFVEVSPVGEVDRRDAVLAFYAEANRSPAPDIVLRDPIVRRYAGLALVVASLAFEPREGAVPDGVQTLQATYVAVATGTEWRLVSVQYTPIRSRR